MKIQDYRFEAQVSPVVSMTTHSLPDLTPKWDREGARQRGEAYLPQHVKAILGSDITEKDFTPRVVNSEMWQTYQDGRFSYRVERAGEPRMTGLGHWHTQAEGVLTVAEVCPTCDRILGHYRSVYDWDGKLRNWQKQKKTRCMDCNPWTQAELDQQARDKRKEEIEFWLSDLDPVDPDNEYSDGSPQQTLQGMIDHAPEGFDVTPLKTALDQIERAAKAYRKQAG